MFKKLLRRLGLGEPSARLAQPSARATEYRGFFIDPQPEQTAGGYRVAGHIFQRAEADSTADQQSASDDNAYRSYRFVRADIFADMDTALDMTIQKGQRIIDERGKDLFPNVTPDGTPDGTKP